FGEAWQDEYFVWDCAAGLLAENSGAKLIGVIPPLTAGEWNAVVKTQFTGSGSTSLKAPRVIESSFILTVV
ncbi:MAG: DUF4469 domain-containing protein, partial [Treponema sp.]|nr:DUF4469 domain-containing protein [Treponema sp.]